jgi:hypothetical protein
VQNRNRGGGAMKLRKNYKFKNYRISQWIKILTMNFKENRFMCYLPLSIIINEVLPLRTYPLEKLIHNYLISELINDNWTKEDKEKFLTMLKEFLKINFNLIIS